METKNKTALETAVDFLPLNGTDYIELYVGNAKQAAHFYKTAFGFQSHAYSGPETGVRDKASYVLVQNKIRLVLTTPLIQDAGQNDFLRKHGDGVKVIALWVDDAYKAFEETTKRGAKAYLQPETLSDENGEVRRSGIHTYGDVVHIFVERKNYNGTFMPGYKPWKSNYNPGGVGLQFIDHCVGNVGWGEMNTWATFYNQVMGFDQLISFDDKDISTEYSALMSKVMASGNMRIKFPINEPAEGKKKSQIEEYIEFNHVIINDAKGNKAIANGKVYHKNLKDFYFDVDIATNKTQVLNTGVHDNELFYGEAYVSGRVNISGYLDYIKMDIGLKSEKGTEINIPLSNPEEVSHNSFITFVKSEELKDSILKAQTIDLSGIEMNFDLEVTSDATIRLEFDPKIGDVIKGTGHGNIIMNISPAEGFKMYGDYIIERGQYLFTLQNVLSKEFTIENGGYVRWSGDPYDAYINIDAHYKNLNASLYDLLKDSTIGYTKAVPVVLTLNLSDKLFNPVIKFDIDVKNIDATTESRVRRAINTEEAKYKQAVSLLVIRRFSPAEELSNRAQLSTGDVVGANAYEFLSAQLSNWASQINENVNVGLNYQPGSNLTQEEWELALGTSFFNDVVRVEGNVGVANSNSTTTTNQNTSSLVGDFNVEVKANKDGITEDANHTIWIATANGLSKLANNTISNYTKQQGLIEGLYK